MAGTSPAMTKERKSEESPRTIHAHRNHRLRQTVPRFPLERAGAVQHCNRLLRSPCRRHGPAGAGLCRREGRRAAYLVRRNAGAVECVCQCAEADGLARGDRVAVFLSQSLELPIAHLAAFRSGLVSVPLFTLFGEDALEFRLANSGARAVVTDEDGWEKLSKIRDRLPYCRISTSPATPSMPAPNHSGRRSKRRPSNSRPSILPPAIPLLSSTPRYNRKSEGRAARPPRAARAPAERRDGA